MAFIEDYIKKDELVWQNLFNRWSFKDEYEQDAEIKPVIDFLVSKVTFWYYMAISSKNPFSPMADFTVSGGGRSINISDLNKNDFLYIESILKFTKHNLILGFMHDILGIANNDNNHKLVAAQCFAEFAKETAVAHQGLAIPPLERAFALLFQTKATDKINALITLVFTDSVFANNISEIIIKVDIAQTLEKHYKRCFNDLLPYLETLYQKHCDDVNSIEYVIKLIRVILNIYKSKKNAEKINECIMKYTDLCCNIPANLFYLAVDIIEMAIKDIGDMCFECTNKLRFKKQEIQTKFIESMNMQSIPLRMDDKMVQKLESDRQAIIDKLKKFNSIQQFCYFHTLFYPMTIKVTEDEIENKNLFEDLFNHMEFNEDNEIIYQSIKATSEQKKEHDIWEQYRYHCTIAYDFILSPYIQYLKFDDEFESVLKDICKHNLLIKKDSDLVYESICFGLNKKIRTALTKLLPMFEENCRLYVKNMGVFPVIRKGGKEQEITLAEIFIHSQFRNIIVDLIGEDLVRAIDYLACKPAGTKIRNKIAHKGLGNDDKVGLDEMALFFYLIKAYCLAYDNDIE